jgi:hypothetical protein
MVYLKESAAGLFCFDISSFQDNKWLKLLFEAWLAVEPCLVNGPSAVLSFFFGISSSSRGLSGARFVLLSASLSFELKSNFDGVSSSGLLLSTQGCYGAISVILKILNQLQSSLNSKSFKLLIYPRFYSV